MMVNPPSWESPDVSSRDKEIAFAPTKELPEPTDVSLIKLQYIYCRRKPYESFCYSKGKTRHPR